MTESRRAAWALIAAAFLFSAGGGLYAQSAGQLGAEIQALEQRLASNMPAAERHSALVRLARLRQLSGNIAVAGAHWLEAAALNPADEFALVSGAYCLAAIGEWEMALAVIQPLLAPGRTGPSALRARYLYATLRAWTAFDIFALISLASDPEAAALHPIIYYTLWWTESRDAVSFRGAGGAGPETWRQRLLSQHPQSPEARIVAGTAGGAFSVSAVHSPLWLFLPGVPAVVALGVPEDSELAALVRGVAPQSVAPPPFQAAASQAPAAAPPTQGQQTGLFRSETNARGQAEALRGIGFPVVVQRRVVDGAERWAVVVPAADPAGIAGELRTAGYNSFTVQLD